MSISSIIPVRVTPHRRNLLKGMGVGVLTGLLVSANGMGLLTILHVADVQTTSHGTLNGIASVTKSLKHDEKLQLKGNGTVGVILTEAGKAVGVIELSEYQICQALKVTCPVPTPVP